MFAKRTLKYFTLGLIVLLVGFAGGIGLRLAYVQAVRAEKREVLVTTSIKIGAGEQKFTAFYLSAPADSFDIKFNVSSGSIKFSPWDAHMFENSLGWFEYHNGTGVEKHQIWFFEGNNGTAGCGIDPTKHVNQIWYILFYNEDSYEKEVYLQVTKVWHGLFN